MVVVKNNIEQPTNTAGDISGAFTWVFDNLWLIIIFVIIIALAIIIYMMMKNWEEERQERDEPIFQAYKNKIRDCNLNANLKKINNKYSLKNLFFLGIPIIRKEHSAKIVNYQNELLGYYRGHAYSPDGFLELLLYKTKSFFIIEDLFLLRVPHVIKREFLEETDKKDKKGKNIVKKEVFYLDFRKWYEELNNGDIRLICTNFSQESYFRYPNFIEQSGKSIDLRSIMHASLSDMSSDVMISRVLNTGSVNVEKAMLHNPNLKYNQMSPQKTIAEIEQDNKKV